MANAEGESPSGRKQRAPAALLHPLCIAGIVVGAVGLGASLVGLASDHLGGANGNPYHGILTFIIYPSVMAIGIGMTLTGIVYQRLRARRDPAYARRLLPKLDLRVPSRRRLIYLAVAISGVFVLASILGASRAYEFTESREFCGELCHGPMGPEYATHRRSPHANVSCVECHVGPRFENYVEAKIAGMKQVYHVATDSYPRPIRITATQARKMSENCTHCHWPGMFREARLSNRVRFGFDAANTRRRLQLLLRDGAGNHDGHDPFGHWHSELAGIVDYWAVDSFARVIARVEVRRPGAEAVIYDLVEGGERVYGEADIAEFERFSMDCLTCHNRPAHRFPPPDEAVDREIQSGRIDASLPFAKLVSTRVLADSTIRDVPERIESFYATAFPEVFRDRHDAVRRLAAVVGEIKATSQFSEMNVDWRTYPDNIGHRTSPGCFRCHGGNLVARDGRVLPDRCDLCHVILARSRRDESLIEVSADIGSLHPFPPEKHATVRCWECHSGNANPQDACARCHTEATHGTTMAFQCSTCHRPDRPRLESATCATCHPMEESRLHAVADHTDCLACHRPHEWTAPYRDGCIVCHFGAVGADTLERHHPGRPCVSCHDFKGAGATINGLVVPQEIRNGHRLSTPWKSLDGAER